MKLKEWFKKIKDFFCDDGLSEEDRILLEEMWKKLDEIYSDPETRPRKKWSFFI